MKKTLFLFIVGFLVSCEKDKVLFEQNVLDPAFSDHVVHLDSLRPINGYLKGFGHVERSDKIIPEGVRLIHVYKDGIHNTYVPFTGNTKNFVFYDYSIITFARDYTYNLKVSDANGNVSKPSNSIIIHREP
jgi:hypothetical protein